MLLETTLPLLRRFDRRPAPIRLGVFFVVLALVWLPGALPLYLWLHDDANLTTIATMSWLFIAFLILVGGWGRWVRGENLWVRYGIKSPLTSCRELLQGLSLGILAMWGLFGIQGLLGWQLSQPVPGNIGKIVAEGLLSGLGIAFAEEFFFRGWLLAECDRDYGRTVSHRANAAIFACLHFLKPPEAILRDAPAFPGLVMLGAILVSAKRRTQNRLGMSVGLHAGLVWGHYIVDIGNLLKSNPDVPVWLTGINGNPLASVFGWIGLFALARFV